MATLNILFVKNDPYRLVATEKKIIYLPYDRGRQFVHNISKDVCDKLKNCDHLFLQTKFTFLTGSAET